MNIEIDEQLDSYIDKQLYKKHVRYINSYIKNMLDI